MKTLFFWLLLVFSLMLPAPMPGYAGWHGPHEIVSGTWGRGESQFGIERDRVTVWGPILTVVLADGKIVISDEINAREKVYNGDGTLSKIIPWHLYPQGVKTLNPEYTRYRYTQIAGYSPEGHIWMEHDGYVLKSPSGEIIRTSPERPGELGVFRRENGRHSRNIRTRAPVSLVYPDTVFSLPDVEYPKHFRDMKGNLHFVEGRTIVRYGACGNVIARLEVPASPAERQGVSGVHDQGHGDPIIGPDGNVYTGRSTAEGYSIVKWVWRDEPGAAGGPEPPPALMAVTTSAGLFLTWKQSPQDPGCVTGYEVTRAANAEGPYNAIAKLEKGVLKYNDQSAESGKTYYYKVRAVAGNEHSKYSDAAEVKR